MMSTPQQANKKKKLEHISFSFDLYFTGPQGSRRMRCPRLSTRGAGNQSMK
jgi:hypothetical protein